MPEVEVVGTGAGGPLAQVPDAVGEPAERLDIEQGGQHLADGRRPPDRRPTGPDDHGDAGLEQGIQHVA